MNLSDISIRTGWAKALAMVLALGLPLEALAQNGPFTGGWTLKPTSSTLNFQSVKKQTKVESSSFATFHGEIDPTGAAKIIIKLESVDTKVDLRNVRMRFLFFESFLYPDATITTQIDPALLANLHEVKRKLITMPYTLDLHGIKKTAEAEVVVTLLSNDLVAISTSTPISVAVSDFALMEGLKKLEEAVNLTIIPSASVTFDFLFGRNTATDATSGTGSTTVAATAPQTSDAQEVEGNFDSAACKGRFETMSLAGNIYFASGSARLSAKSAPLLDNVVDIISRCPGIVIEVGGHTDSDGSAVANKRLSIARAHSVTNYLAHKGIDAARTVSVGYGEEHPVVANDSHANKRRNRRIEFAVISE